jgi:phosphonopyruvate decarboxylase
MVDAQALVDALLDRGYSFWTGVPCSYLSALIACLEESPVHYVAATSEGEATGIAAGAYLSGHKTVVLCQNSGLGNMVNPLTSLNEPYRIPTLIMTSRRGGDGDEPQHSFMGHITCNLLSVLGVPWELFPDHAAGISPALDRLEEAMTSAQLPAALVVSKSQIGRVPGSPQRERGRPAGGNTASEEQAGPALPDRGESAPGMLTGCFTLPPSGRISRAEAVLGVWEALSGRESVIATTGKVWRELYSLGHRPGFFYLLGSMGCASPVGLGVSLGSGCEVVVLDGDGSALMKMGAMATTGRYAPRNLTHVVLDNEAYETTGGQQTSSVTADLALVAQACGYRWIGRVDTLRGCTEAVVEARRVAGPRFIHVKVSSVSDPAMPKFSKTLTAMKSDFMEWLRATGQRT